MEININGNPGTGNSYNIVQISHIDNYNPNAKEVHNHLHIGHSIVIQFLFLLVLFSMAKAEERSLQLQYDKVEEKIEILEYDMELQAHGQSMLIDCYPTSSKSLCPLYLSSLYTYLSDEVVLRRKRKYY